MIADAPAKATALLFMLGLGLAPVAGAQFCELKPDETIVFFPALGYHSRDAATWQIEVRGCVFEPEKRRAALALLTAGLRLGGVSVSEEERTVLADRARLFMVDNERGKQVVVKIGGRTFRLGKSGRDGTFSGIARLPAGQNPQTDALLVEAVLPPGDPRRCLGRVVLLPDTGLSIISDIDDTIKVTSVRDRTEMLRNSFLEKFREIPGMAQVYSRWATNLGAQFCYVSASPWQFYPPLSEFMQSRGFPEGLYRLKHVRWNYRSVSALFEDPMAYKMKEIQSLLNRFPKRRFVLIGDSGERDPEIFGRLARQYPLQIQRILIREVTEEPGESQRYRDAFRGLPDGIWMIFHDPASLEPVLKR